MFPFTLNRQKCCLPVGNMPVLEHLIQNLNQAGISEIVLLTDFQSRQVQQIASRYPGTHVKDTTPQNLLNILNQETALEEECVLANGDIFLFKADIENLLTSYQKHGNSALLQHPAEGFRSIDSICALADKEIQGFFGHPRSHYVNALSCGIAVVNRLVLDCIPATLMGFHNLPCGGMPDESFHLEELFQNALEAGISIQAVYVQYEFADLNFPWDIMKANDLFCQYNVENQRTTIDPSAKVNTDVSSIQIHIGANTIIEEGVIFEGNCRIGSNSRIGKGTIVGKNCVIGDHCSVIHYAKLGANTVIGHHVKVGFTAEVSGVLFDYAAAVHNCEVYGVIGSYVDIAAGVTMGILRFDDASVGNKVLGKTYHNPFSNGIFIGDWTRTGVNNVFYPGIKVGSYCAIAPGLMIDRDIADHQLILEEKKGWIQRDWSNDRYGW